MSHHDDEDIWNPFTINNIMAANRMRGFLFFHPATMAFWGSVIEGKPYCGPGGVYFVTSEVRGRDDDRGLRFYNVRRFEPGTGRIWTADPHMTMTDRDEAVSLARTLSVARP